MYFFFLEAGVDEITKASFRDMQMTSNDYSHYRL